MKGIEIMLNHGFVGRLGVAVVIGSCLAMSVPAAAGGIGSPLKGVLGRASDNALDKLAKPGAFMADEAVRIAMPGPLKEASALVKLADQAGLTNGLTQSLNNAAGLAAAQAKPIFRTAINRLTLKDSVKIVSRDDGATRYLKKSAGTELRTKIRPLILNALEKTGAFSQLGKLGAATSLLAGSGISRDGLTDSVTDQALAGIFKYIGNEEASLREDPMGAVSGLLNGF